MRLFPCVTAFLFLFLSLSLPLFLFFFFLPTRPPPHAAAAILICPPSAAWNPSPATAAVLLAHGADIDGRNRLGLSPLHAAANAAAAAGGALIKAGGIGSAALLLRCQPQTRRWAAFFS